MTILGKLVGTFAVGILASWSSGAVAQDSPAELPELSSPVTMADENANKPYFELMGRYVVEQAKKDGDDAGEVMKAMVGVVEYALYRLGFYRQSITGKENPSLRAAIKRFQKSMGSEPTGDLLMGEFIELDRRKETLDQRQVVPENELRIVKSGDFLIAEGTWTFKNGAMRFPIQTTEIRCTRRPEECVGVTASLLEGGAAAAAADLDLSWRYWKITKWSDEEVVAENDDSPCVAYTLTISPKANSVYQFRRGKGGEGCEQSTGAPEIMLLADGTAVARQHYENLRKQTLGYYDADFLGQIRNATVQR